MAVHVQPGLCSTWSETPKTGFLTTRLNCLYFCLDLNEDGELELLDSDIKDLKRTNMMEESQVIKMKAEMACLEGKVQLCITNTPMQ